MTSAALGDLRMARIEVDRLCAHLRVTGTTLATAESCTGGLAGALLTELPGSSAFYLGGVIAYTDRAKIEFLDVPSAILLAHGAVSGAVAQAMAEGARLRLRADLALSITGIAGPGGATPTKPIGLVFVATATGKGPCVVRLSLTGDRHAIRAAAVTEALRLASDQLVSPQ